MYKVSNIISMPVISIYESKVVGYIQNLLFNSKTKKCEYVVITSPDEIEYVLHKKDINSITEDSLTIQNQSKLNLKDNEELNLSTLYNPINAIIYDINGKKLQNIKDISLDKSLKIENYLVEENLSIDKKYIISFTENIAIYSKNNKVKLSNYKPKSKIVKESYSNNSLVTIEDKTTSFVTEKTTDSRILLNRTVTKDIVLPNGEILIKNGSFITYATIKNACMYGKVIELTKYSK
ncbi:MAG: PRC-barrel domain-containing protein [Clostridia bacterium]|nr:PRC-barrel domain-containing protein [Clostridia bacterium]